MRNAAIPAISLPFAFRYIEKTALNAICCPVSDWVYVCVRIRLAHASASLFSYVSGCLEAYRKMRCALEKGADVIER